MSRIGKQPVPIPDKVKVDHPGSYDPGGGPEGQGQQVLRRRRPLSVNDRKQIIVTPVDETRFARAMYGTARSVINGMVKGVTAGFSKDLEIQGVGFKAILKGRQLDLVLGYSHPILFDIPEGITVTVTDNTKLKVEGRRQAAGRRRHRLDPRLLSAGTLQGEGRAHRRRARPPQGRQDRGVSRAPRHPNRNPQTAHFPVNTIKKAQLLQKRRWRIRQKRRRHRRPPAPQRQVLGQAHLRPGDRRRPRRDRRLPLEPRSRTPQTEAEGQPRRREGARRRLCRQGEDRRPHPGRFRPQRPALPRKGEDFRRRRPGRRSCILIHAHANAFPQFQHVRRIQ